MTKFFNEKGKLNFDLMDLYFDKNDITYDSNKKNYIGTINGRPVHIFFESNEFVVSYDDCNDGEVIYFYDDDSDRLLSHYFISTTDNDSIEISNSNITFKDGKFILTADAARWTSKPLDDPSVDSLILDDDNFVGASTENINSSDIIGHNIYDIDDTFTSKYGLTNIDIESQQAIENIKPISLEFMLAYEGLLDMGYSKVTRNANAR